MINFRFHLVSLVAVFLALGLGILVGSTVIDQRIVNRLDTEIHSVRNENDAVRRSSNRLSSDNTRLQQFVDATAPYVGDARLGGDSVAIIAERGVDDGAVKETQALLRAAGADVPAVLWLEDQWLLDNPSRVTALSQALGLHGDAATVRRAAFELLARRLAKAPARAATTSTSTTSTSQPARGPSRRVAPAALLGVLEQAGFLGVSDGNASTFDAFPAHAVDVVIVTGDDSHLLGIGASADLARALDRVGIATLVGAVYDAGGDPAKAPARGASLSSIVDDSLLSSRISTVDDLELTQGRVAAVLALAAGGAAAGHYGYGSDASAPVPPHRP